MWRKLKRLASATAPQERKDCTNRLYHCGDSGLAVSVVAWRAFRLACSASRPASGGQFGRWQRSAAGLTRPVTVTDETPQRWHYNGDRWPTDRPTRARAGGEFTVVSAMIHITSPLQTHRRFRPAASSRSLRIHLNHCPPHFVVLLSQTAMTLCLNATDYTDSLGAVQFATDDRPLLPILSARCFLCGCFNMLHYMFCLSVCLFVCLSFLILSCVPLLTWKQRKNLSNWRTRTFPQARRSSILATTLLWRSLCPR